MRVICGAVMLLMVAGSAQAQDSIRPETTTEVVDREVEWQNLMSQAFLLVRSNEMEKAEAAAREAAEKAEAYYGEDAPRTTQSLNDWGYILRVLQRYSEAEAVHWRALAMRSRHLDGGHSLIIQSKSNLAKDLFFQHKYEEAHALFADARRGAEDLHGSDSFLEAGFLFFLGRIADIQERHKDAGEFYAQSFDIHVRHLPDSDGRLIEVAEAYADWLRREQREAEAEAIAARYLAADNPGNGIGYR